MVALGIAYAFVAGLFTCIMRAHDLMPPPAWEMPALEATPHPEPDTALGERAP